MARHYASVVGYSKVSNEHYGCSTARNRGTCDNRLTIRRDVLETSVLDGLKRHLMKPELVKEFITEYHRELNRLSATRDQDVAGKRQELQRTERQIRAIVEAIKEGIGAAAVKDELGALEAKKTQLITGLERAPAPTPLLHPNLTEIYRQKVARLEEELSRDEMRAEAIQAIRSLIESIRLVPEDGKLQIELEGDLAAILALTNEHPRRGAAGVPVTLVAGTRIGRDRHSLTVPI